MTPKTRSKSLRDRLTPESPDQRDSYIKLQDRSPTPHPTSSHSDIKSTTIVEDPFAGADVPPVYSINLSLPPAQRYVRVARDFRPAISDLPVIFDEIIQELSIPSNLIHLVARLALRRLYSAEQTEELRGISRVTGVPMYLLVAFNVLLDLFMGCTSGAVRSKEFTKDQGKMLHFRTLDWDMPALKKVIVQFEFREYRTGPVIARAINYVGYVGMLTAVRKGLSISLNFRAYHNNDGSRWANTKFRGHQLSVLLGFRPSISAHLRDCILPSGVHHGKKRSPSYEKIAKIARDFPSLPTTAAYLVFCDGRRALLLEKDRVTANSIVSSSFIVTTNHDISDERSRRAKAERSQAELALAETSAPLGMQEIIAESVHRKTCMAKKWERRCKRLGSLKRPHLEPYVRLGELKSWVEDGLITTPGLSHFSTIMDPSEGKIVWIRIPEDKETECEDEIPREVEVKARKA